MTTDLVQVIRQRQKLLLPNYLIEKALSEHVTVALNGSGGDELFAGYGRYFQLPVEQRYLALPAWLRVSFGSGARGRAAFHRCIVAWTGSSTLVSRRVPATVYLIQV